MSMIMDVLFISVFFIEMLISIIFFSNIAERKKSLTTTIILGTLIFEIGAIINIFIISTSWINVTFSFLANLILFVFFFKTKPIRAGFYSLLLVTISTFLEHITVFIVSSLSNLYLTEYKSKITLLVIEIIISKILYFLIAMMLLRFSQKDKKIVKVPITFYVFPLITLIAVISFWYISLKQYLEISSQVILGIVSFLLFLATLSVFFSFQANAKRENELLLLQQEKEKIKTDINYYDILERQNNNLRIYAHDAKNHLSAIKNLNNSPEIDTYVSKMIESLEEYSNVSHSGNKILDVIINKYVTECNINNINFFYDIKNNNLIGLEFHDIVSILGNLLDNAIEGVINSKEKSITFETDYRNNYTVIIISNSCDNRPILDNNKFPLTTKTNTSLHGFGLKSVKRTIKKYDGDLSVEYDDNKKLFIATIMLDLNK